MSEQELKGGAPAMQEQIVQFGPRLTPKCADGRSSLVELASTEQRKKIHSTHSSMPPESPVPENAMSSSSPITVSSRRTETIRPHRTPRDLGIVPVLGLILLVAACGSTSNSTNTPSNTPSSSPSTSASGTTSGVDCSSESILAALPSGSTMVKFDCAKVGDIDWAAAQVDPGSTIFFLQWSGTTWSAEDSDSVCGDASAGLPPKLLAYCPANPSSSPS